MQNEDQQYYTLYSVVIVIGTESKAGSEVLRKHRTMHDDK